MCGWTDGGVLINQYYGVDVLGITATDRNVHDDNNHDTDFRGNVDDHYCNCAVYRYLICDSRQHYLHDVYNARLFRFCFYLASALNCILQYILDVK